MELLTCKKCGYKWAARTLEPKQCPACKSRYWNKAVTVAVMLILFGVASIAHAYDYDQWDREYQAERQSDALEEIADAQTPTAINAAGRGCDFIPVLQIDNEPLFYCVSNKCHEIFLKVCQTDADTEDTPLDHQEKILDVTTQK